MRVASFWFAPARRGLSGIGFWAESPNAIRNAIKPCRQWMEGMVALLSVHDNTISKRTQAGMPVVQGFHLMASRLKYAENWIGILMPIGILVLTAVIGSAQIRNYRPPPPKTASPDMIELGGPEWGFAHSNPTFLASFNLTELLKSSVGQWILSQTGRALSLNAAELDRLTMVLGEIDHISASAQPRTARQTDGVVLLTGHFENHLLTKLIQISGGPAPRMLDANTMLLGDNDSVEAALQRISNSWNARRSDPSIQRARRLTAAYDF